MGRHTSPGRRSHPRAPASHRPPAQPRLCLPPPGEQQDPRMSVPSPVASAPLLANRWWLRHALGAGRSGQVYLACDASGACIAVKLEPLNAPRPTLPNEVNHLTWLNSFPAATRAGVPRLHFAGDHAAYRVLALDLLGPSLQSLHAAAGSFSEKCVLMLAVRVLRCVQFVHSCSVLHRDITPANLLVGYEDASKLYLVDYGLARQFRDHYTRSHFPYREGIPAVGTVDFASVHSMRGRELGRRDDLESLGYCLVYLFKGVLPWMNLGIRDLRVLQERVCVMKRATRAGELCKDMPREFAEYFRYVRRLGFHERPDYAHLRRLFRNAMRRSAFADDGVFDWISGMTFAGSGVVGGNTAEGRGTVQEVRNY